MSGLKELITFVKNPGSIKMINNETHELSEVEGTICEDGDIIIFFANLYLDRETLEDVRKRLSQIGSPDAIIYLQSKHEEICGKYSDIFADVLMLNTMRKVKKKSNAPVARVVKWLQEDLDNLCVAAHTYCSLATRAMEKREDGSDSYFLYALVFEVSGSLQFSVHYCVYPLYINGILQIYDVYNISDSNAVLLFDLSRVAKERVVIKKCANCGKFFRPISRSDEIYCNNVFRNGKTCKELGYEIKVSKDQILNQYRKIYKTQNARKQRNAHRPGIAERFDIWKIGAKEALNKCQMGDISLEEMLAQISSSDWITGAVSNV